MSEAECYLTIAELHRFREYYNKRLTFTMERIPREVKRVLTANIREKAEREPVFADDRVA